ncbi:hypothetical protein [Saccharospirillum mangrovi]|uniref:hypothetical protein n=1 Tax=Saccharospirillum mangrovi TaxID=2161747 RepID=UPI000D36233C|nr:hypothetical protein [Saccharospirillum mangrovi]
MSIVKALGLSTLLAVLVLTGCSSNPTIAPYMGEDEGMLVFSTDIIVRGEAELEYNYIFSTENLATGEIFRQRMTVDEGRTYAVVGRLPAGDYRFVKREDIRRDGRGIRLEDISGEFSVAAGEITLPKHIMVNKSVLTRSVEITDLSDSEARILFDLQLADNDDFRGWRFHGAN